MAEPEEARAICHRCGAPKRGPFVPCKACGFTPAGEERPVAWLFGDEHLTPEERLEAALRIRTGERPDPSRALREMAREAMGIATLSVEQRRPLRVGQALALAAANLLLTPLAGFAVWYGLREDRPVAAAQALKLTWPLALALALLWTVVLAGQLAGWAEP